MFCEMSLSLLILLTTGQLRCPDITALNKSKKEPRGRKLSVCKVLRVPALNRGKGHSTVFVDNAMLYAL